jgi:hypothetical protein
MKFRQKYTVIIIGLVSFFLIIVLFGAIVFTLNVKQSTQSIETIQPVIQPSSPTMIANDVTPAVTVSTPQIGPQSIGTPTNVLIEPTSATTLQVDIQGTLPLDGELIECSKLNEGKTYQVSAGTFLVGDIEINGIPYYNGQKEESTVAFFEKEVAVLTKQQANCYRGNIYLLNQVIQDQFIVGCDTGCDKVRMVVIRADGQEEVQCYYPDGSTKKLQQDGHKAWCP